MSNRFHAICRKWSTKVNYPQDAVLYLHEAADEIDSLQSRVLKLELELLEARQHRHSVLDLVAQATILLATQNPAKIKYSREKMQQSIIAAGRSITQPGAPKGSVDFAFSIARLLLPKIKDNLPKHHNLQEQISNITCHIKILKGSKSWHDFRESLKNA